MKTVDIVAALVLIGLSALIAYASSGLPYWTAFAPGPAFASYWVAGAGALIGAVLLIQALRSDSDEPADWPDGTGARQVLAGAGGLWLLLIALPYLGTALSGLLFMLSFLLFVARRPVLPSIFASLLTVAVIEGVFVYWLKIRLPTGLFGI